MKILLLGDSHGSPYQIEYAYRVALEYECDAVFSLGDYGFWEHAKGGPEFLDITSEFATYNEIPFFWLDGNHEAFHMLRNYSAYETEDGFWEIRKNLYYSPRGHRFEWDDIKFMTYGGAFSIDRSCRKIGVSWWWEEEIDPLHVDETISDTTAIDILLSHDVPSSVDIQSVMTIRSKSFYPIVPAQEGRRQLDRIVQALKPQEIFHGHYHIAYTELIDFAYGKVRVRGLDCEGSETDSWFILDTKDRYANTR